MLRQQLKSTRNSSTLRADSSDWENTRLALGGSGVQIPFSQFNFQVDQFRFSESRMDLNMISKTDIFMATAADGWPVWIPPIVGLAPGLVYWIVITGMKKRR